MALQHPEGLPAQEQEFVALQLVNACRDLSNQSERFRSLRSLEAGAKFTVVDDKDTTFLYGFKAEHDLDETTLEPIGQTYNLCISVSHLLKDYMPVEVTELVESRGDVIHEAEVTGVEVEYSLEIYLDSEGELEWIESRNYDIWYVDTDAGDDSETEQSAEILRPPTCAHYHKPLGRHLIDRNETAGEDEDESADQDEDTDQAKINKEFEAMMGLAGLSSFDRSEYFQKARAMLEAYRAGEEAEFDTANYFPEDIVQSIKAGHTY